MDREEPKHIHQKECLMMWLSFFFVTIIIALILLVNASFAEGAKYLYHVDGDSAASFPVEEYLLPDNETAAEEQEADHMHPDFLYKPDSPYSPPPRLVEFYAPWCPHCKHFKPHLIEMAQQVNAVQPTIKFHAISCTAHNKLCKAQEISGYPTVKLYKEGSYTPIKVERFNTLNVETILTELGFDAEEVQTSTSKTKSLRVKPPGKQNKPSKLARVVPFRNHEVSDAWHDAAMSFEFALTHSIYMSNGAMPEKEKKAFYDWLDLLSKTLPPQMDRVHQIIKHILENFEKATNSLPELTQLLKSKFPPLKTESWRTCTYENNDNGYTCGLWQLFHVMSVGVVEHNKHGHDIIPTGHVSETLRNYIENFFQCEVCRMNFLLMYDNCEFDRCHRLYDKPSTLEKDWQELPLWIWEVHNDVNVRLMGERLERDNQSKPNDFESQQARWPALFTCPNCWREDKSWQEEEVYRHLHSVYWHGNPTHLKLPDMDEFIKSSSVLPRSWKIAGALFATFLLFIWLLKSNQLLARIGKRREKKY